MGLRFSKAFQLEVYNGGRGGARRGEAREGGDLRSKLREVKVVGTANGRTGERYKREREEEKESWKEKEEGEKEERGREGMIKEVAS